jgi:pimeloyl-ACP methyl ester carboxylesterase
MLAFHEAGHRGKKPLIFVHGWCCNRLHMEGLLKHFSTSHNVFAVDLPGHGRTPLEGTPPVFDAFAATVSGFLVEHGLSGAVLVGHSMGGILSVMAAGETPELVAAVVNLDGALPLTPSAHSGYRDVFARINAQGFRAVVPRFLSEVYFLPHERGPLSEKIIADMLSVPESLALALMSQFPTLVAEPVLRACHAPVLFIGGSHPRFDESTLLKLRPDAWIARVAVSGHFLQVFALPQITAMIEKFLEFGIDRAPSA